MTPWMISLWQFRIHGLLDVIGTNRHIGLDDFFCCTTKALLSPNDQFTDKAIVWHFLQDLMTWSSSRLSK